jgi:type I restriction enzyme S subunit
MNQIQQLINQMCPNGVEYQPLWTLTAWDKHFNGVDKNMQKKVIPYKYYLSEEFNAVEKEDGDILYIATGVSDKKRFTTEDLASDYIAEGEIVCIPWGGTPNVKYYKGKFVTGDNRIATSLDTNVLNNKFLYYWMCNSIKDISLLYRGAGIKHPSMKGVLSLQIPLPPLAIQTRIVEILDHFTNLTANLTAELNLRRKQFEHYREKLLSLDGVEGVEWKTLGEVCEMKRGNNVLKTDFVNEGIGCIHYGQIYTHYDLYATKTNKFISKEVAIKAPKARKNDVVITITSENVDDLCKPVAWLGEEDIAVSSHALILRHNQNAKFLSLLFISENVRKQKAKFAHSGKVTEIIPEHVGRIVIPVPPLATQHSIVSVLDKFTALIENIEKELALRQKQYEYYREELLRFGG